MTEIYLHFLCAHYGLSGSAPVQRPGFCDVRLLGVGSSSTAQLLRGPAAGATQPQQRRAEPQHRVAARAGQVLLRQLSTRQHFSSGREEWEEHYTMKYGCVSI